MESGELGLLQGLSDAGLQRDLVQLLVSGCRTEARLLAHLAEVERRRLFLKEGFGSLYKYCQRRLGLSENESFHRMTAARIALRYPVVLGLIEQRKIHLSGVCALRDFLTRDNHRELLQAVCGKTKTQIEELLATRFPGRKKPDSMRRLPARARVVAVVARPEPVGLATNSLAPASPMPMPPQSLVGSVDVVDPVIGEVTSLFTNGAREQAAPVSVRQVEAQPQQVAPPQVAPQPVAPQLPRYRVQFDASSELKAKIELARALSSHANPIGDLAMLFERALDAYVEHLQKKRFAKTDRPRRSRETATPAERSQRLALRARVSNRGTNSAANLSDTDAPPKRGRISNDVRRAVLERDGLQCAFVSERGQRCDECAFLELHHEEPSARGGGESPENLHVFCRAHNRLQAERDFGVEHVARAIERARTRSAAANERRGQCERSARMNPSASAFEDDS